MLSLIF